EQAHNDLVHWLTPVTVLFRKRGNSFTTAIRKFSMELPPGISFADLRSESPRSIAEVEFPIVEFAQVRSDFRDSFPEFQVAQPACGEDVFALRNPQQLSHQRTRGVGVAVMVYCHTHGSSEVARREGAVDCYPQGLLTYPSLSNQRNCTLRRHACF